MPVQTPTIVEPSLSLRIAQRLEFRHKLGICERLFGRSLAPHGICWIRTAAGLPWKLDLSSPTDRWIVYGKYEGAPFLDWAKRSLPPDGVVVDSGANIGQMLLYLAQWVPRGKVLAFEPGEAAAGWLSECLELNRDLPVELIRCGLGSEERELSLASVGIPESHGSSNQIRPAGAGAPVRVRRLADLLGERGLDRVDLWKLDVEGHELEALAGAEPLLRRKAIRALYCELAFGHGDQIRSYLARFGYECQLFDARGGRYPAGFLPNHTNGLFLPG
jgi:FkbM family methyltransferase